MSQYQLQTPVPDRKKGNHLVLITQTIQKIVEKMKAMNLPAIWHRKKQRMLREQIAIRDSIYNNVINASSDNVMCNIVNELQDKTDGNLFGTWDIELNSYM